MLRQRTVSATLIVIGTLLAVIAGGWVFFVAALLTLLLAIDEFMTMVTKAGHQPARLLGAALVAALLVIAQVGAPARLLGEVMLLCVVGPLLTVMLRRNLAGTMLDWAVSVAGILYVGWLGAHAVLLRGLPGPFSPTSFLLTELPEIARGLASVVTASNVEVGALAGMVAAQFSLGLRWTLTAVLVTWATDTAAFFAGRAWGRHQLTPLLSPKKTREGAIGGLVAAAAAALACVIVLHLPLAPWIAVVVGVMLGTLAQAGDLAESLIKRQTGVKDAGNIIPGHGGVLDRIDSLLFTLPATYYLATFVS